MHASAELVLTQPSVLVSIGGGSFSSPPTDRYSLTVEEARVLYADLGIILADVDMPTPQSNQPTLPLTVAAAEDSAPPRNFQAGDRVTIIGQPAFVPRRPAYTPGTVTELDTAGTGIHDVLLDGEGYHLCFPASSLELLGH